jgi:hypothetical protein
VDAPGASMDSDRSGHKKSFAQLDTPLANHQTPYDYMQCTTTLIFFGGHPCCSGRVDVVQTPRGGVRPLSCRLLPGAMEPGGEGPRSAAHHAGECRRSLKGAEGGVEWSGMLLGFCSECGYGLNISRVGWATVGRTRRGGHVWASPYPP